jgi:hypothetical protein
MGQILISMKFPSLQKEFLIGWEISIIQNKFEFFPFIAGNILHVLDIDSPLCSSQDFSIPLMNGEVKYSKLLP